MSGHGSVVGSVSNLNPLALQRLDRDAMPGILGTAALFDPDDAEGALMTASSAIVKKRYKAVVCKTDPDTRQYFQESVEWDADTFTAMADGKHTALNARLLAMGGAPGASRSPRTRGDAVAAEDVK